MKINILKLLRFLMILVLLVSATSFFFLNKNNINTTIETVSSIEYTEPTIFEEHIEIMNINKHKYRQAEEEVVIEETEPEPKVEIPEYNIKLSRELQIHTWELCQQYNVEYEIILGILRLESNFEYDSVSRNKNRTKDRGIAQINDKYEEYHANLVGIQDFNPFNPEQSIELCVRLMARYNDYWRKQGVEEAKIYEYSMGFYNRGLAGIQQYIKSKGTSSTAYSRIVFRNATELKEYGKFKTE